VVYINYKCVSAVAKTNWAFLHWLNKPSFSSYGKNEGINEAFITIFSPGNSGTGTGGNYFLGNY
jgi:hypothetical protein